MDHLRRRKGVDARGTHRHEAAFDSVPFDFWQDDITPLIEQTEADIVVFTAAVEPDVSTLQLREKAENFFGACTALRVVYLSGDAIFDGAEGNYSESDPPSPATLYGENLGALENLVRDLCADACIIRPSYLYGFSSGAPDFRLAHVRRHLLSGKAVHYAEDMFKSPMEITLAGEAVTELALSNYTGTVHISGARTSVYTFYRDTMTTLGVPIKTLYANRLPADAPIPKDTSLDATLMTRLTGVPVLSVREAFASGLHR